MGVHGSEERSIPLAPTGRLEPEAEEEHLEYKKVVWMNFITKKKYIRTSRSSGSTAASLMSGSVVDTRHRHKCLCGVDGGQARRDCECTLPHTVSYAC